MGLYVCAALLGTQAALVTDGGDETLRVVRILLGLVIAHVIVADAKALGKPLPHFAVWQICMFWSVAVPGCVIALRKGRGVLYLAGHVLLFILVALGTAFLVDWLVA